LRSYNTRTVCSASITLPLRHLNSSEATRRWPLTSVSPRPLWSRRTHSVPGLLRRDLGLYGSLGASGIEGCLHGGVRGSRLGQLSLHDGEPVTKYANLRVADCSQGDQNALSPRSSLALSFSSGRTPLLRLAHIL
jgi:hypothetical protein